MVTTVSENDHREKRRRFGVFLCLERKIVAVSVNYREISKFGGIINESLIICLHPPPATLAFHKIPAKDRILSALFCQTYLGFPLTVHNPGATIRIEL